MYSVVSSHRRFLNWTIFCLMALFVAACGSAPQPSDPEPSTLHPPRFSNSEDAPILPDRLELPSIDLESDVVELGWHSTKSGSGSIFNEWDVAEYAVGWHKNSALLAEGGNIVMSAHNNILGSVFRELDQVKKGDEAVLWSGDRAYTYVVDRVMIVPEEHATPEQRAENARWIEPSNDDRLTLVSCWPRDDNSHRIIVVARPTGSTQASNQ